MRTIDAHKFKEQVATMTIRDDLPVDKANAIIKLIDMQPTVINGIVTESEYAYRRMTYIRPTEHHYEEPGEKPYIKYGCPVCEALGNIHRVIHGEKNCPLCGVNLSWGEPGQKNIDETIRCDERCRNDVTSCPEWDTDRCKLHG